VFIALTVTVEKRRRRCDKQSSPSSAFIDLLTAPLQQRLAAVAKFFKSSFWTKCRKEGGYPYFRRYPNFITTQCRIGGRNPPCQNQLNPFSRRFTRGREFLSPAMALSGNSLGQAAHTHVPLSPSSIIWYRPMGGDALRLGR